MLCIAVLLALCAAKLVFFFVTAKRIVRKECIFCIFVPDIYDLSPFMFRMISRVAFLRWISKYSPLLGGILLLITATKGASQLP